MGLNLNTQNNQGDNPDECTLSPKEKELLSKLVIILSKAFIQTHNYGTQHVYSKDAAEQSFNLLKNILKEKENLSLCITEGKLRYKNIPIEESNLLVQKLVTIFSKVNLVSLKFKKEITLKDLNTLLNLFYSDLEKILNSGGIEKLAKTQNLENIDINPLKYALVENTQQIIQENSQIFQIDDDVEIMTEVDRTNLEAGEQIIGLINDVLKENSSTEDFIEKVKEDPNQIVNWLIEAIKIIEKLGIEKSESFITSIMQKLIFVKNEINIVLDENKLHPYEKKLSRFSNYLHSQINNIKVSEDMVPFINDIKILNCDINNRLRASNVLAGITKDNLDVPAKKRITKSIGQQQKISADYLPLLEEILSKRNFNENEFQCILEEGKSLIKNSKKIKKFDIKDIPQENFNNVVEAFNSLKEGILILDNEGYIILINKLGVKITNLSVGGIIEGPLLNNLKFWPKTPEINSSSEKISEIFSTIQSIKKDQAGNIRLVLLTPKEE